MLLATFHVKTDDFDMKQAFSRAIDHAVCEVMPALKEEPHQWAIHHATTVYVRLGSTEYYLYQFTLHKDNI